MLRISLQDVRVMWGTYVRFRSSSIYFSNETEVKENASAASELAASAQHYIPAQCDSELVLLYFVSLKQSRVSSKLH